MRASWRLIPGIIAVWFTVGPRAAAQDEAKPDKPLPTLAQDREKLAGLWKTDDWRKPGATAWQCYIAVSLQGLKSPRASLTINLEQGDKSTSGPVLGSPVVLKEQGDRRWFALDRDLAKRNGLPAEIDFRFDGDTLTLKLDAGPGKGEYKLHRVKPDK
jgi:hypothetical protein